VFRNAPDDVVGKRRSGRPLFYLWKSAKHSACRRESAPTIHVCPKDSGELRAQLAFRDRLRDEPELASAYADLRQIAVQFRHDREAYAEAKTAFVTAASGP
jgi:GrpB-like predicted nucleotidyltransferase (UPF0157 family)